MKVTNTNAAGHPMTPTEVKQAIYGPEQSAPSSSPKSKCPVDVLSVPYILLTLLGVSGSMAAGYWLKK